MKFRRKPVKAWQVILIAVIVVGIFVVVGLMRSNYNIPYTEEPFGQEALEKARDLAGAEEGELYATGFTYNNSEEETFVVTAAGPGANDRWQEWSLICYAADGQMPYRMEKGQAVVSLPEGAEPMEGVFARLGLFRENREAVFSLFSEEGKAAKGESNVLLDLRDRFGETDLLVRREAASSLPEEGSSTAPSPSASPAPPVETRVSLEEALPQVQTVTVSDQGVAQAPYTPGDCTEESFLLYRSGVLEGTLTETLLAVVNIEV